MEKETDAEQGWFSDYSDSTFDGDEYDSELDEEYIDEISEDWYDYDEEYYEEDDDCQSCETTSDRAGRPLNSDFSVLVAKKSVSVVLQFTVIYR